MKPSKLILLSASLCALSACSTIDSAINELSNISMPAITSGASSPEALIVQNGECPVTEIVTELSGYSEFATPQSSSEDTLVTRAHLTQIESECTVNERSMTVDLKLEFQGMPGPRAHLKSADHSNHAYPFFVAITAPTGEILAKEVFSAAMDFRSGDSVQKYNETLRQIIPLDNPGSSKNHKILVGFQLDQQQLNYNRSILAQQKILDDAAELAAREQNERATQIQTPAPLNANDPIVINRVTTP